MAGIAFTLFVPYGLLLKDIFFSVSIGGKRFSFFLFFFISFLLLVLLFSSSVVSICKCMLWKILFICLLLLHFFFNFFLPLNYLGKFVLHSS